MTQSNLSKHINTLLKANILKCKQKGKERFYKINTSWKNKWKNIVEPQIEYSSNKIYKCSCGPKGGKCGV